jgi:redox-sensitive bicupin YhaK (pirin superfamily)
MTDAEAQSRAVTKVVRGTPTSDGAGVRLTRVIGGPALPDLDPFLLLDEFDSDSPDDYLAGFPDHPHRGFETVTYMLDGRMRHGDNQGNSGILGPGSIQWMTAGRGIVHSEMPEQEDGLMRGFQLWVNLPASDKMTEPRYQDIDASTIPEVELDGGARVRVLSGRFGELTGPVAGVAVQPTYLDIELPPDTSVATELPGDHTAFLYLFEGSAKVGETAENVQRHELAVLGEGSIVSVTAAGTGARMILVAGRPLGEPVARYGPFVMNTPEEIQQAFADFAANRF